MPRPGTPVVHPDLGEQLRPTAEAGMPDECTIRRAGTGEPTFDPVTGDVVPPAPVVIYEGPCRVEARPTSERVAEVGGEPVTMRTYDVAVPVRVDDFVDADGRTGVHVDDVVELNVTDSVFLLGRPLRVIDVNGDSIDTERSLACVDDLG